MHLTKKFIISILLLIVVVVVGFFYSVSLITQKYWLAYFKHGTKTAQITPTPTSSDPYVDFTGEVYDKIKENYWEKVADVDLGHLFNLAAEKAMTAPVMLDPKNKDDIKNMVAGIIKDYDSAKKEDFVTRLADIVLANLKPAGRSRLYTSQAEKELRDTVENRDASVDLYAAIGATKDSTPQEIENDYQKKINELKSDKSPEAPKQLAQVNRAYETLSKPETKKNYDKSGVEPTVNAKLLSPDIFYIKLDKFSPQSFDELYREANSQDPKKKDGLASPKQVLSRGGGPTTLILDLRDNIGGAIDILQYFLGPFIGPDQYAYEFFHQGNKEPFKTKVGWFDSLVRYKKVVILINENSQSSAEVMVATLKKYNVGVLVGKPTKGWGTVEQLVPINTRISSDQKYSILIVQSITLREDGQPIEGRGVDPNINIADKDWPTQLMAYFNYPQLVPVIKELFKK